MGRYGEMWGDQRLRLDRRDDEVLKIWGDMGRYGEIRGLAWIDETMRCADAVELVSWVRSHAHCSSCSTGAECELPRSRPISGRLERPSDELA